MRLGPWRNDFSGCLLEYRKKVRNDCTKQAIDFIEQLLCFFEVEMIRK